ncbi:HET-domain-containing protein [Agrocybe pediades]|nr:HET-domain-containing protein [Agrocybe pediades]
MKELCNVCKTLDLAKLNNRKPQQYNLGLWGDVKKRSSNCPFCYLVIRSSPSRAVWDEDCYVTWGEHGGFTTNSVTEYIAFLNAATTSTPLGSARQVEAQVNPALVARWLDLCEKNHGKMCSPRPGPLLTPENQIGLATFRVVDVIDLCLVDATPETRYITLSYVWGDGFEPGIKLTRANADSLYEKGAFRVNEGKLPVTIKHAMEMVRKMGQRYIWIDSLCLKQDDDYDRQHGIAAMDMVYQCAELTLIAAAGTTANYGIPGVLSNSSGDRRVKNQLKVAVLPGIEMTITKDPNTELMWSFHGKRGWTMQELHLSYRTLIFTDDMAYFCCRQNTWAEDTAYDRFPKVVNEIIGPNTGWGLPFLSDNEPNPLCKWSDELGSYALRKLKNPTDTIDAFRGLLNRLAVQSKSGLLHGLLTVSFDIGLMFSDISSMPVPRASGLPTYGRRPGFATWSWAGWTGGKYTYAESCNDPDGPNLFLQHNTYITWYFRSPEAPQLKLVWDGLNAEREHGELERRLIGYRPIPRDPYGRGLHPELKNLQTKPDESDRERLNLIYRELRQRKYPLLQFFAHVVQVGKLVEPEPDLPRESRPQVHKVIGTDGERCGSISVDDRSLLHGVKGPYDLILLSKVQHYNDFIWRSEVQTKKEMWWVMLIVWVGVEKIVAERRGIGCLYFDDINCLVGGRKVWKEIVLA